MNSRNQQAICPRSHLKLYLIHQIDNENHDHQDGSMIQQTSLVDRLPILDQIHDILSVFLHQNSKMSQIKVI